VVTQEEEEEWEETVVEKEVEAAAKGSAS